MVIVDRGSIEVVNDCLYCNKKAVACFDFLPSKGWLVNIDTVDGFVVVIGFYDSRDLALLAAFEAVLRNWTYVKWISALDSGTSQGMVVK